MVSFDGTFRIKCVIWSTSVSVRIADESRIHATVHSRVIPDEQVRHIGMKVDRKVTTIILTDVLVNSAYIQHLDSSTRVKPCVASRGPHVHNHLLLRFTTTFATKTISLMDTTLISLATIKLRAMDACRGRMCACHTPRKEWSPTGMAI